jgi:surface antigen
MRHLWLLLGAFVCLIVLMTLLITLVVVPTSPFTGDILSGDGNVAVVTEALQMAEHLHCFPEPVPPLDCASPGVPIPMDAWFDAGFPPQVLGWGQAHCAGCPSWQNGQFQCVVFVIGAYLQSGTPLPVGGENANQYWDYFAHQPGWIESQVPTPGAIMAWSGGLYGHVSIVLSVDALHRTITFAQANGQLPVQTLPLRADGSVDTHNGYWNFFTVQGYIRSTVASKGGVPSGSLPNSPYVSVALEAARAAGIDETTFVRQINAESGFTPNAVSPVGAIGIAQFMPATAAGLGINPWDPVQSLDAAARDMATLLGSYGGDEAKALAAYNAGSGTVDHAIAVGGANWQAFLPLETQRYIHTILG